MPPLVSKAFFLHRPSPGARIKAARGCVRPEALQVGGMKTRHWLVKQEPEGYSWKDFLRDGGTSWDGVRNYQARNNLKAMAKDDKVLFYESGDAKSVAGLAKVSKEAYPDPTSEEPGWVSVGLVPVRPLPVRVSLAIVKAEPRLAEIALVRNSRLSVMPLSGADFALILKLATP
jgi:predicted RNA-binding protein with PUA-like domain